MERNQESRRIFLLCLLSGGILVGMALYFFFFSASSEEKPVVISELSQAAVPSEKKILVYVVGAVKSPGVYEVSEKSRVYDAVKAAGDVLPYADIEAVNMAEEVSDGEKLYIPMNPEQAMPEGNHLVNINQASQSELKALPGVGAATAEKIIQYREEHGLFQKKEDIKKVPSIGDSKFQKMADRITL